MKPAPFTYVAPTDITDALTCLAQHGEDAKILAGGQSLMPLMNMRLARPQVLIDINRLTELAHVTQTPAGGLAIGALTRQRVLERSPLVCTQQPLLAAAVPLIGHVQIRNRGTLGGSLVHADPAAELPAVSLALDATLVVRGATGQRLVPAADFFVTSLTTALAPEEMLTEVRLPAWEPEWGWDVQEVCRREGDFALAGAVTVLHVDDHSVCQMVRLVVFGVSDRPVRAHGAERTLLGQRVDDRSITAAARVVTEELETESDMHASALYRQEVGGVLTRRTLENALRRAQGGNRA